MNFRRGLFRLWVIFAVLFIVATAAGSYGDIKTEFSPDLATHPKWGAYLLLPMHCSEARGTRDADYSIEDDLCWYQKPRFSALYPEYSDLSEPELSNRLYARAGRPRKESRPWTLVAQRAGLAIGVPLAILGFGRVLIWALSGFRQDSERPRALQ